MNFTKRYIGPSTDHRTNRWSLTCPKCQKVFVPTTTMMARRDESCPKCDFRAVVNYNQDPPPEPLNL
jgi:DNA-directed RNA polymerase subunit RPC12/RpoP